MYSSIELKGNFKKSCDEGLGQLSTIFRRIIQHQPGRLKFYGICTDLKTIEIFEFIEQKNSKEHLVNPFGQLSFLVTISETINKPLIQ